MIRARRARRSREAELERLVVQLRGELDALRRIVFGTPGLLDHARRASEERGEMKLELRRLRGEAEE